MHYRTAARLAEVQLVSGNKKYLFCDTKTILPKGLYISKWSGPFKRTHSDSNNALLSIEKDEVLLKILLARTDFVISINSSDYAKYQQGLKLVLNNKFGHHIGDLEEDSTIGDYILKACVSKKESTLSNYQEHSEEILEEKLHYNIRAWDSLEDQVIYLTKVPEDITYKLWDQFTGGSPITYYELSEEGDITSINLVEALANTCSNFESTVLHGCITCGDRKGCLDYLSGFQLSANADKFSLSLHAARKLLTRADLNYIPPSIGSTTYRDVSSDSGKLDYTRVNITVPDITERYQRHKLKFSKVKESALFYKEHCSSCSKKTICGIKGFASSSYKDGYLARYINKDYCTGAKKIEITPDSLEDYINVIFRLLFINAKYNYNDCTYLEVPTAATSKIIKWVFEGSQLDKYASACIKYIEKCSRYEYPASVIPVEIEQALKMLGLVGGFENPNSWHSNGISNRQWVSSKTDSYESCFPGIPAYSAGKWVVMTQPGTSRKLASPSSYSWSGKGITESIDTSLYASMYNIKVSNYSLKRFQTVESRMHLALSAIKLYTSPSIKLWFGPFGSKTDFAPASLNSSFYKQTDYVPYYLQSLTHSNNPDRLTLIELVMDILQDISKTRARYDLQSLELLSSLGEVIN